MLLKQSASHFAHFLSALIGSGKVCLTESRFAADRTGLSNRRPLGVFVEWEAPAYVAGNAMKREEPVAPPH